MFFTITLAPALILKEIMGHQSFQTTEKYIHHQSWGSKKAASVSFTDNGDIHKEMN